jgi:hypothetical protein
MGRNKNLKVTECVLDSSGIAKGLVVSPCECCDEPSGSMKFEEFMD